MKFKDLKTFTQKFYAPNNQSSPELEIPKLFFLNGENAGLVVSCETGSITIGRSLQNKVILNLSKISKNHCEIIKDNKKHFLMDHNSKNGTYLNNKRLEPGIKAELSHGDIVNISDITCLFINPVSSTTRKKMAPIVIDKNIIAAEANELIDKYKNIITVFSSRNKK